MDAEPVESLRSGVKGDRPNLPGRQIHGGRGPKLDTVRQVDLNANQPHRLVCGIPDGAGESFAGAVVPDD